MSDQAKDPHADLPDLLLGVTMQLMKNLSAHMRQSDQHLEPAHAGLLAKIGEGPCRISDLARHQCVQVPTISRSVSVLVQRGLVERWIPETNRRTTMVRLSRRGRSVLSRLMQDARRHTESLLSALDDSDRGLAHRALSVLSRTLTSSGDSLDEGRVLNAHGLEDANSV
jgi:DNA-binding MarR family transcriptional regulator